MFDKELKKQHNIELASYYSLIFAVPITVLIGRMYQQDLDELGIIWENLLTWLLPSILSIVLVFWASSFKCPNCKNSFFENKFYFKTKNCQNCGQPKK
jgi:hypothetical protein